MLKDDWPEMRAWTVGSDMVSRDGMGAQLSWEGSQVEAGDSGGLGRQLAWVFSFGVEN